MNRRTCTYTNAHTHTHQRVILWRECAHAHSRGNEPNRFLTYIHTQPSESTSPPSFIAPSLLPSHSVRLMPSSLCAQNMHDYSFPFHMSFGAVVEHCSNRICRMYLLAWVGRRINGALRFLYIHWSDFDGLCMLMCLIADLQNGSMAGMRSAHENAVPLQASSINGSRPERLYAAQTRCVQHTCMPIPM